VRRERRENRRRSKKRREGLKKKLGAGVMLCSSDSNLEIFNAA